MTIHFFTYSDELGGSSRQKAFLIADELNARGMRAVVQYPSALELSAAPWPEKGKLLAALVRALGSVRKGDVIYIQRAIANKYLFALLAAYVFLFRRTMIFDFDDPIFLHSYFKTMLLTRLADAVVVNHEALAVWARRFNPNVTVVHISLDLAAYKRFEHEHAARNPVVIGWTGNGIEHRNNLALLAAVFRKLKADPGVPEFSFTLLGALGFKPLYEQFESIPGLETRFIDAVDWHDPEGVPREVQRFDIGVIPNATDPKWSKLKSSFKVIEYMACGVATIASDFGEMPNIIADGRNGFLAKDEEEWAAKLKLLLADAGLRARLGKAGQETVRERYCFDATVPRLMQVIQGAAGRTIR